MLRFNNAPALPANLDARSAYERELEVLLIARRETVQHRLHAERHPRTIPVQRKA